MRNQIPVGILSIRTKPVKSKKGKRVQRKTEREAINPYVPVETDEEPGVGGAVPVSRSVDPLLVIPDSSHEKGLSVYDVDIVNPRMDVDLNNRGYSWRDEESGGYCPETFQGEGIYWPDAHLTGDLLGIGSTGRSFQNQDGTRYRGLKGGGVNAKSESFDRLKAELKAIREKHEKPEVVKVTWEEAKESGEGILVFCEQEGLRMPEVVIGMGVEEMRKVVEKQLSWRK